MSDHEHLTAPQVALQALIIAQLGRFWAPDSERMKKASRAVVLELWPLLEQTGKGNP